MSDEEASTSVLLKYTYLPGDTLDQRIDTYFFQNKERTLSDAYSTTMSGAMKVMDALVNKGLMFDKTSRDGWVAILLRPKFTHAEGLSFPHAICLLALKYRGMIK